MAFPQDPLPNPWEDGEDLEAATLYARITEQLNALAAAASFGLLGSNSALGPVTLATAGQDFVGPAKRVITITSRRKLRVVTSTLFSLDTSAPSGTTGRYRVIPYFNVGSTANVSTGTTLQVGSSVVEIVEGVAGEQTAVIEGDVTLNAGTYAFFGGVQRVSGGTSADVAGLSYVAVYDVGGG